MDKVKREEIDRRELGDRLARLSSALAGEARQATVNPEDLTNCYLLDTWPISPQEHQKLLETARALRESDAEIALNLAKEYLDRLRHYTQQWRRGVPLHVIAVESAVVMRSVESNLCLALDRAASGLHGATDNKTDKKKKLVPTVTDVLKLAKIVKRELPKGRTKKDIALEFADGNAQRAEGLLRQLRRYEDLLK